MHAELKSENAWETADDVLREDPVDCYAAMDRASQAHYLEVLVRIAKRTGKSPLALAEEVLRLASNAHAAHGATRASHVGYYLVGEGRFQLMSELGLRLTLTESLRRGSTLLRLTVYLTVAGLISSAVCLALASAAPLDASPWIVIPAWLVTFVASTHTGVHLANQLVRLGFPPERLPRYEFDRGVPARFRTLVVVPCMLTTPTAIDDLSRELEALSIGNADRNIGFCLITDYLDSDHEREAGDASLLSAAVANIEMLNRRHGGGFLLMHRCRTWNSREGKWMGRERKRGKLEDLNAVLLGDNSEPRFSCIAGDSTRLKGIRYVITIDEDMGLQPGDARRMIATLAHPLNEPVLSADEEIVEHGFGLLQPSLYAVPRRERPTRYERLYGTVVRPPDGKVQASIYQDLFAQSSYCGKGIYDVRTFHKVLHGRFPDNQVLSHDMLEGAFIRSGLVSDIVVAEEFPETYLANMQRRHRWLRGDWQTVPWMLPLVRDANEQRTANRIPGLGRWFVIDNIRRIMAPIAQLIALFIGLIFSTRPEAWIAITASITFAPVLTSILLHVWLNGRRLSIAKYRAYARTLLTVTLFNLAFLVHESKIGIDAVLRSSYRQLISKRRLLEWIPQRIINQSSVGFGTYWGRMWVSPAVAATLLLVVIVSRPATLPVASPLLVLWCLAPVIAWWLGGSSSPQRT